MAVRGKSRTAALVAAAAVATGSVLVGVGTATAQDGGAGSSAVDGAVPGLLAPESIAGIDVVPPQHFNLTQTVENVTVRRYAEGIAERGKTNTFAAYFFRTGAPSRHVTTIVDYPPAGFAFEGVTASLVAFAPDRWAPSVLTTVGSTPLTPESVTVDPTTGAVTIVAPDGGWEIPEFDKDTTTVTHQIQLYARYRIADTVLPGPLPSGLTYDVTGLEGRQGSEQWEGSITRIPLPSLFDVFGS